MNHHCHGSGWRDTAALRLDSQGLVSLVVGRKMAMGQLIEDKGSDKTAAAVAAAAGAAGRGNDLHLPLLYCTCVGEVHSCSGRPWLLGES